MSAVVVKSFKGDWQVDVEVADVFGEPRAVAQRLRNLGLAAKVHQGRVVVDADAPMAQPVLSR